MKLIVRFVREREYYRSKGWFFSCDGFCQSKKLAYEESKQTYTILHQNEEAIISEAKSTVGLFSTYGVYETRDLFWQRFNQGKQFAKRQSFWDMIFMGIGATLMLIYMY